MSKNELYMKYIHLLETELKPALGCTEPIAIAYAAAKAVEVMGSFPDSMVVECSGNIIKNVKGVIVPTTGDLKGVEASAILGAIAGNASKELEVLSDVKPEDVDKTRKLLNENICSVQLKKGVASLYIKVILIKGDDTVHVEIMDTHTNIIKIMKNDTVIYKKDYACEVNVALSKEEFNVNAIYEFANSVDIKDVKEIIDRQIEYNIKIAEEGMAQNYGVNVGKILNKNNGDIKTVAKAYAAAGSDARMAGCTLPVIINSGSGNQGITASLPVIKYAQYLNVSREKLIRALVLSNLLALYQKSGIGKLSAYCGAVSAGCGAGAAISYLYDMPLEKIKMTIKNVLGNISGIVCDGAKASCAAKVASSVDAAIMGHEMAMNNQVYSNGEGLNDDDVDQTIDNVAQLAKKGMKETDIEIIEMMIKK